MGTTLVVWNPNAGSAGSASAIRTELERRSDATIIEPHNRMDAERAVRDHCRNGTDRVIAAGGDGTINAVVNGLSESRDVTLGVLPLGTANDWCSSLAIPDQLDAALDVIDHGEARLVDIAEVRTASRVSRFANIATGGNSHRVTQSLTDEMKKTWGAMCYVRGAVEVLTNLDEFNTAIRFDGGIAQSFSVWNIIVANGKTSAGRLEIAPRANLEDGLLDIVIIESGTLIDIADLTTRYVFGEYIDSERVIYRQANEISISSSPPVMFSIDGDLIDDQPIVFRAIPKCQRVMVGPNFER